MSFISAAMKLLKSSGKCTRGFNTFSIWYQKKKMKKQVSARKEELEFEQFTAR
jgi:hypothetical protein